MISYNRGAKGKLEMMGAFFPEQYIDKGYNISCGYLKVMDG